MLVSSSNRFWRHGPGSVPPNISSPRGSDELFTHAVDIRGQFPDGNGHLPKPDFWFGLGLYKEKQLSRLRGLELKDKGIEYLTQKSLVCISQARTEKLIYQPVKSGKCVAFPWMVVELKKEKGDKEECVLQAANASHTSLMLCEQLAARASRDPLPIVAFTSVGPKAKLFIAYKARKYANNKRYVRPTLIPQKLLSLDFRI